MKEDEIKKQAKPYLIQEAYRQHWLHARHVKTENLLFTSILTALIAGVLVGTKDSLFDFTNIPLLIFVIFISLFGLFFTLKKECVFKVHTTWAKKILEKYELKDLWQEFSDESWIRKKIRSGLIIPIYFWFFFSFTFTILIYIFLINEIFCIILFCIIFTIPSKMIYNIKFSKAVGSPKKVL